MSPGANDVSHVSPGCHVLMSTSCFSDKCHRTGLQIQGLGLPQLYLQEVRRANPAGNHPLLHEGREGLKSRCRSGPELGRVLGGRAYGPRLMQELLGSNTDCTIFKGGGGVVGDIDCTTCQGMQGCASAPVGLPPSLLAGSDAVFFSPTSLANCLSKH